MFIIYTKTGCLNCSKAKLMLYNEPKIEINCDQLLKNDREAFMKNIETKMKCKFKSFPIIFIDDIYLGSYDDLIDYLNFELVEEF
jgi:glutaredoxin